MDSSLLKIFVAVAKNESISLGAEELQFTQSNVTLRIKQLEKNLGFKLFHRIPKGVKLTYEGEKLLPLAKDIVQKVKTATLKMQNINQQSLLRIGTSQANATIRILPFIKKLSHDFPNMDIEILTDGTPQITDKLYDYKVDIALIMGRPKEKEFMVLNHFEDIPVMVESRDKQSKNTLIGYREKSTHFDYLKKYFINSGTKDFNTMIIENYEVMLGCVELGLGYAFVSKHIIEKFGYLNKLKLTELDGFEKELDTYLICRSDNVPKIEDYLKAVKL